MEQNVYYVGALSFDDKKNVFKLTTSLDDNPSDKRLLILKNGKNQEEALWLKYINKLITKFDQEEEKEIFVKWNMPNHPSKNSDLLLFVDQTNYQIKATIADIVVQ